VGRSIHSKRLIIRPLLQKDFGLWKRTLSSLNPPADFFDAASWIGQEDISKEIFYRKVKEEKEERRSDKGHPFHCFLKDDLEYIGYASLSFVIREPFNEAQILYNTYNKFIRKGYAKEFTKAIMDYGFHTLNLHRIYGLIHPKNKASKKVMESLKFRFEGLRKKAIFYPDGKWHDMRVYALTEEEFKNELH